MRRRLLLLTAATTALVLTALLVPLTLLTRSHAADRATAEATARAQWVAHAIGPALASAKERATAEQTVESVNGHGLPRTSLILGDGSGVGPGPVEVTDAVRLARTGRAFTYEPSSGGRQVLVPVHGAADGTAVVQVTLTERQLYAGTLASWLVLAGIGVGLVLLGLLLADRLGARLVGATRSLARTADRLAAGDLTARAAPEGPPELRLVAAELNRLAARIDDLLTAERARARESAADLAHRLRTPVAALRLDAETLRDGAEARRIATDVAALERSVDDVIRAARRPLRAAPRADLAAVARERAAFWQPLAEDQGRASTVDTPPRAVPVPVPYDELCAAVDALIGNVLDHTPQGTAFHVSVAAADGDRVRLVVADEGPGFPGVPPARGASGGGSTGLGLDIARRTAEDAGGAFAVASGPTRVTLTFPRAASSPPSGTPSAPPAPTG
ncbi:sensor histidine kinase [Streptomyces sp. G45]|uniref:sensor histidine kinase n=1 Tax=Streptomyces sp. G45 TaxID=3406627 RepID=UPI003C1F42C4